MVTAKKFTWTAILATAFLAVAVLACGTASELTVSITSPPSGSAVRVGEQVEIVSSSAAAEGVAQVQLSVNGLVVRGDVPPSGNPTAFSIAQPWTPTTPGEVRVSVVAFDTQGGASQPAVITLRVEGEAVAAVPDAPVASATPVEDVETGGCTLNASYVADVTIPDDTEFAPGTAFVKTWRVRNSGTCDWAAGFNLVFVSGDQMGGEATLAVVPTAAGSTSDLSVHLTAPSAYGTYRGNWRMQSDEGLAFGSTLYAQIVVPAPATSTPVATDTPLATDTPPPTNTPGFGTLVPLFPHPAFTAVLVLPASTNYIYQQTNVAAGASGAAVAECPGSSVVVGGGFAADPDVSFYTQYKFGNGWRGDAQNNTAASKQVTVYAVCLYNVLGASVTQVHAQVDVTPGNKGQAVASCPAGTVATGGGYHAYPDGSLRVYNSSKADGGEGWQSWAQNTSGATKTHHAYAMCLAGSGGTTQRILQSATIAGSSTGYAIPKCASGALVTGGGFAAQDDLIIYSSSGPYSEDEWRVYVKNTFGSNRTLFGYAVCLSLP